MITIEKNIPFRSDKPILDGNYPRKWPWPTMKPGDSFVVTTFAVMHSARRSFYAHRDTVNTKVPPSWFVTTQKISGSRKDGVYRLWLFDKENPETPVDTTP